jgi:DNA-binding response OmpR family regulator
MVQADMYDAVLVRDRTTESTWKKEVKGWSASDIPVITLGDQLLLEAKAASLRRKAFGELLERMQKVIPRAKDFSLQKLEGGGVVIFTSTHEVRRDGKPIRLTPREFALLELFMRNRNRILSRAVISEKIWNYDFDTGTNVIDVYVNHLRGKIDSGFEKKLIQTVRGVGYLFKED